MNRLLVAALPLLIVTPAIAQESGTPGAASTQAQTKAEAEARVQMIFDQLDTDHDGVITQEELAAFTKLMGDNPRMIGHATRMFTDADTNHDGRLSAAEAKTQADAAFDVADTNHDGVLSPEERMAARQRNHPPQ